jgi:hypothetical protein
MAGVRGGLTVVAMVLAARFIALLAILGAFVVTLVVLQEPDPFRLTAVGLYCVFAGFLSAWLTSKSGP